MTLKTATAALALPLVLAAAWFGFRGLDGTEPAGSVSGPALGSAGEALEPQLAAPRNTGPARVTNEVSGDEGSVPGEQDALEPSPSQLPPGRLLLSVTDAATGAAPAPFTLRLLSDDKFAHLQERVSPVDEPLSPGHYEALLLASGYDPLELPEFEIESGAATDLGVVSLLLGTGAIEGIVRAPSFLTGHAMTVELHGIGRNPCAQCAGAAGASGDLCPACGYGAQKSVRRIRDLESFAFHSLAAGDYTLVVRSAENVLLFGRELRIEAAAREWLELELEFIDIDLALKDHAGEPFDGTWSEEGTPYADALRFYFWQGEVSVAAAETPPFDPTWIPPAPEEVAAEEGAAEPRPDPASEARLLGKAVPTRDRADDERKGWHSLWPRILSPRPKLQTRPLTVTRHGVGEYRLKNVPIQASSVQLTCGPYFSKRVGISLAEWDGLPIEVRIEKRCGASTEMMAKMQGTACTACHAMPDSLFE